MSEQHNSHYITWIWMKRLAEITKYWGAKEVRYYLSAMFRSIENQ